MVPAAAQKPIVSCAGAEEWQRWLAVHAGESDGIRLAIAKTGGDHPSVSYAEALDEALCVGWINIEKFVAMLARGETIYPQAR
jgi:uncharacterized protein YdeI (YjbR/CyaY-like superfamily)